MTNEQYRIEYILLKCFRYIIEILENLECLKKDKTKYVKYGNIDYCWYQNSGKKFDVLEKTHVKGS